MLEYPFVFDALWPVTNIDELGEEYGKRGIRTLGKQKST